jgi:type I restriction enzyme R subunit
MAIRDEIGFLQALRASFAKNTGMDGKDPEDLDSAIQQIVSKAVTSDQVVDIFSAAGLQRPDISILSDSFLEEVRGMPQKNLAREVLKKLLSDFIKVRSAKFLVQSRSFAEMLEETIRKYHNRAIEAAAVIEDLIQLAKDMREADKRGEKLGLSEAERAFYDALETNDSAVKVLGDDALRIIAKEIVETVHGTVSIDWTVKESVRAKLRAMVKRVLRKHGYPPDKQERATQTVLEQAELIAKDWAA